MSWKEIDASWAGLQKRHRSEIAQAVARYCVGHDISEVARQLGQTRDWVQSRLDFAGFTEGVGGTTPIVGKDRGALEDVQRVIREYGPSEDEQKSERFEPYVNHYLEQGHEQAAAARLARAEWAAEAAVEAGVVQESVNKRNEKVNQILFPTDEQETFELDMRMHMARVVSAARFLDTAKINYLRLKTTCERVASANEKWIEQVERVLNLHPTLGKE
jgi:predicted transcriptional regulator